MLKPKRYGAPRYIVFTLLVCVLAGCGAPARPAPTFEATPSLPTRIPVRPTAGPASAAQPGAISRAIPALPRAVSPTAVQPTRVPAGVAATQARPTTRSFVTATRMVTAVPGDSTRGKIWFEEGLASNPAMPTCKSCHNITDSEEAKTGVNLKGIIARAASRVRGQDAWTYLHTSIIKPNAFVVPNEDQKAYSVGGQSLMYQNFAKDLTPEQIDDIVAYLLTLK